ncbi:CoA transferase [Sandaracinobacteroides sp. A072]|uniref:CoA transferase n=1 Tax=Sandaracinobacteroides sp. A072 TaxID=3461146 RepID=UPI004041525B
MIARLHEFLAARLAGLGLSPSALLARDMPGPAQPPGRVSANGACHLLRARDGWVALNLAREEDRALVPVLTGGDGEGMDDLARVVAADGAAAFRDRAAELQMPVALVGESRPQPLAEPVGHAVPARVVDLSALWAGPLCAGLLARAGAHVVRIESLGRPDPTPLSSPRLDSFLNAGKACLPLDLRTGAGRMALSEELARADLVVTSARPAALARLGLEPSRFPHLGWVAITAHGFSGDGAGRVGFGDDCAAAGGLLRWHDGAPHFLGDALADPLTGLEAALTVLSGRRGLVDMAMARVAAAYARELACAC